MQAMDKKVWELAEQEPDLILLDIPYTGMNGIEVRKEILKNSKLSQIPTIVMSADVFSDQKEPSSA